MRKVSVEKWCYVRHYVHPSDASPLPNPTITVLGLASFWEETRPSSVRPSVVCEKAAAATNISEEPFLARSLCILHALVFEGSLSSSSAPPFLSLLPSLPLTRRSSTFSPPPPLPPPQPLWPALALSQSVSQSAGRLVGGRVEPDVVWRLRHGRRTVESQ